MYSLFGAHILSIIILFMSDSPYHFVFGVLLCLFSALFFPLLFVILFSMNEENDERAEKECMDGCIAILNQASSESAAHICFVRTGIRCFYFFNGFYSFKMF